MGKKREIVDVNEDVIKRMIAGNIPTQPLSELNKQEQEPVTQKEKPESEEPDNIQNEGKEELNQKSPRKKKSRTDYKDIFLIRQRNSAHRQTSIILGEDVYSSIQKVLKVADGVSLANFINNVLRHHFSEYREDIAELRRNFMSDLFKDE